MAARDDLMRTGISGLDTIFLGGIPRGNLILIEGAAGAGKTTLGAELIYRGAAELDEPGMIVAFEASSRKLMRDTAGFGWNLEELQRQRKVKILTTSPQVFAQELRSPDSLLLAAAAEIGAKRIFIDGISLLGLPGPDGTFSHDGGLAAYREMLYHLVESLYREGLTGILSHEVSRADGHGQSLTAEMAEYAADTVILLSAAREERGLHRNLEILKSRGQDFESGQHTVKITSGRGIEIFRRAQSRLHDLLLQPSSLERQSAVGVPALDEMLGGEGLFVGSTTMVAGISGGGKSILGMQFLVAGAKKYRQPGLLVSIDEHPAQILRNASTLGLELEELVEAGTIRLLHDDPLELQVDTHFDLIARTVEATGARRLVIDGMSTYENAIGKKETYREFVHALVGFTKRRQLTTFFCYENPELFGMTSYMPNFGVTSVIDNIVLVNLVETGDRFRYAMTVPKARGSGHLTATREFVIGQGGVRLLPLDGEEAAAPLPPFPSYANILSRAPTRLPERRLRGKAE
jgi:circadian clock protein KaiC